MSLPSAMTLHLCCCHLSLVSGMDELDGGEFPIAYKAMYLSHGNTLFSWAVLPANCYEDDFLPKLYHLSDNNVSLYRAEL